MTQEDLIMLVEEAIDERIEYLEGLEPNKVEDLPMLGVNREIFNTKMEGYKILQTILGCGIPARPLFPPAAIPPMNAYIPASTQAPGNSGMVSLTPTDRRTARHDAKLEKDAEAFNTLMANYPGDKSPNRKSWMRDTFKAYRIMQSRKLGAPAYCVCDNTVMEDIIEDDSQTWDDLRACGFFEARLAKYGEDILAITKWRNPPTDHF